MPLHWTSSPPWGLGCAASLSTNQERDFPPLDPRGRPAWGIGMKSSRIFVPATKTVIVNATIMSANQAKLISRARKESSATPTAKHVCQVDQVDQVGSLEMRLGGMACFRFPSVTRFLKSWSRQGNLGEEEGVEPGTFRGP